MADNPVPANHVQLTIDGTTVSVPQGTTIFDAARAHGIAIPTLCHQQNENPVGVCRVCVVDVGAESLRRLLHSSGRTRDDGQDEHRASAGRSPDSGRVVDVRPSFSVRAAAAFRRLRIGAPGRPAGIAQPRFPTRTTPRGHDDSSLAIQVDHEACILCDRCIRGCDDIRHNWVLARRGKGYQAGIAFDNNLPMGESSCVSCGECMVSCPTGALTNRVVGQEPPGRR